MTRACSYAEEEKKTYLFCSLMAYKMPSMKFYHFSNRLQLFCQPLCMIYLSNDVIATYSDNLKLLWTDTFSKGNYCTSIGWLSMVKCWYNMIEVKWWISSMQNYAAYLPWIIDTRNPADLINSISFCVILCVQHALTWPSKPEFDCIPVADIHFTYSCRSNKQVLDHIRNMVLSYNKKSTICNNSTATGSHRISIKSKEKPMNWQAKTTSIY